jgi:hypothetical protein
MTRLLRGKTVAPLDDLNTDTVTDTQPNAGVSGFANIAVWRRWSRSSVCLVRDPTSHARHQQGQPDFDNRVRGGPGMNRSERGFVQSSLWRYINDTTH